MKGTTLSNRQVQYKNDLFFVKRDECAALCTQKNDCKSFEHCNGNKKCGSIDVNLSKTSDQCLKVNGTKVCNNFCILNKVTKPTGVEHDVDYDFCKQDGKYHLKNNHFSKP